MASEGEFGEGRSLAMAASLPDHLLDMADVVRIIDEYQAIQKKRAA